MPYKLVKHTGREGGEWCVHKENPDGSPGENRGCSTSREEAVAHMRALYAHEKKELEDALAAIDAVDEFIGVIEETAEEEKESKIDIPEQEPEYDDEEEGLEEKAKISVASKNDLPDSAFLYIEPGGKKDESGKTVPRSKRHFPVHDVAHVRNAIARIPQSNAPGLSPEKKRALQARARKMLARANKESSLIKQLLHQVLDKIKSLFPDEPEEEQQVMLWKEGNDLRWFVRYSNNFRDDDNPPEIIAAESHQAFIDMVDRKEAAMPQLWLWHVPEWKVGVADWLAYDDSGFALASGVVDRDKEAVVEMVASNPNVRASHGMPALSIVRDPDDPSIIRRHTTKEISLLPDWAAANKLTGFVLLGAEPSNKEDDTMAIPSVKKQELVENWKIDPELLDRLEQANSSDAAKAAEEGRDSKEATQTTPEVETAVDQQSEQTEPVAEETQAEQAEQPEQPVTFDSAQYPTREEVADALVTVLRPYFDKVDEMTAQLDALGKEITAMKEAKDDDIEHAITQMPSASLVALMAQKSRAVGSDETRVNKGDKIAKGKPEETEAEAEQGPFAVPFLNSLVRPTTNSAE